MITSIKVHLKVTLLLGCNQGVPPPPERCICSTFAQVCNSVGTVATIIKYLNPKSDYKTSNTSTEVKLKVTLLLGCHQGVPPPPERCICSTFAQVCNSVGTVATIIKYLNPKSDYKTSNTSTEVNLKVTLLLGCQQGVPPPPERCICSTFAQVCNPVGTVTTIMKIFESKIRFQSLYYINSSSFKSYITVGLQPRCPPTP